MPTNQLNNLFRKLNQHNEFKAILFNLRPGRISESKIATLRALTPRVRSYLRGDRVALETWEGFLASIADGIFIPESPTPRQVFAAMLLAGAAIKTSGLQLRPDLHKQLYQARADLLQMDLNLPPLQTGGPVTLFKARPISQSSELKKYEKFVSAYDKLTKNIIGDSKLKSSIKTLLTDQKKSLAYLGLMSTLDSEAIESAKTNTILKKSSARVNPTFVKALRSGNAYAPRKISLALKQFRCINQQETSGTDEIFWAGSFVRCTNLSDIYTQIERLMLQPNTNTFDLEFKWGFKSFINPKEGDLFRVSSGGPWKNFESNSIVFEQDLFNGFGPWAGVIYCIEDDDAEYDAVSEVIDTIGDYADQVGFAASTVSMAAAAGGITGPLAVASGAVSAAASVVSLGADVAGAVVDIVNFFDSDDMIDSINISGDGDYAVWDRTQLSNSPKPNIVNLQESQNGARYDISYDINFIDTVQFNRNWGCTVLTNWFPIDGGWFDKSGGITGDSDEIERTVSYNPPVQIVEGRDVEQNESDPGTAYVINGYPKLEANGTIGRIKVHWGISAFRSFKFKFYLQAFRFENRL
jgi:hypothetical protein